MNWEWCEEPISEGDRLIESHLRMHRECAYRAVMGSLAHFQKRCSCSVPGSTENDPPGLTKRQAAMKAWEFGILLHTITKARTQ